MSYLEACILGVIQGITEFFPVSSSGHLLITRNIFNINTFDLVIEISLHLGTLMAICIYWKDYYLDEINKFIDGDRRTFITIFIGSLPAGFIGLLYKEQIQEYFFNINSISYLIPIYFIMFCLILSSKYFHENKRNEILLFGCIYYRISSKYSYFTWFF